MRLSNRVAGDGKVGTLFFWLVIVESLSQPRLRLESAPSIALAMVLCATTGCRLTSDTAYSSPSYVEQNEAILDVVSYGATREQVVNALEQEGVQGAFGVSQSVYYCDIWDRGDGDRWHLDIALFFDQSGQLYKVGPSQPDIGTVNTAKTTTGPAERPGEGGTRKDGSQSRQLPISRSGRRTPFAEPDSLE